MARPITYQEFATLRKLTNKAKKHVTEIGKCNDHEAYLEQIELQRLIDIAIQLVDYALTVKTETRKCE